MGGVALAVLGALEPAVHAGAMRRAAKPDATPDASKAATQDNDRAVAAAAPAPAENKPAASKRAAKKPAAAKGAVKPPNRKRAAAASELEKTIGYKFKDKDQLGRALTHISATGGNRNNCYQRLD